MGAAGCPSHTRTHTNNIYDDSCERQANHSRSGGGRPAIPPQRRDTGSHTMPLQDTHNPAAVQITAAPSSGAAPHRDSSQNDTTHRGQRTVRISCAQRRSGRRRRGGGRRRRLAEPRRSAEPLCHCPTCRNRPAQHPGGDVEVDSTEPPFGADTLSKPPSSQKVCVCLRPGGVFGCALSRAVRLTAAVRRRTTCDRVAAVACPVANGSENQPVPPPPLTQRSPC